MWEFIKDPWVIVGFIGQITFSLRMLVQWLASEKAKNSIVTAPFWYLSIIGSLFLFCYAVHRKDPVFIVGQSLGLIVYARNISLMISYKRKLSALDTADKDVI